MVYFLALFLSLAVSHLTMTYPPSNRHGGSLDDAGSCENFSCFWFSQITTIPGAPTLPSFMRTYQVLSDVGAALEQLLCVALDVVSQEAQTLRCSTAVSPLLAWCPAPMG